MRFTPSITVRLDDDDAERVRRSHDVQIAELQTQVLATAIVVVADVDLEPGVDTAVSHRLGRRPRFVGVSAVRAPFGAPASGIIIEVRGAFTNGTPIDSTQIAVIAGFNYGVTVRVDVMFL